MLDEVFAFAHGSARRTSLVEIQGRVAIMRVPGWLKALARYRCVSRSMRFAEACRYYDLRVWNQRLGHREMVAALSSNQPHAIGKIGSGELTLLRHYLRAQKERSRGVSTPGRAYNFFSDNPERYCELMFHEVLPEMTILGVWFNINESTIVKTYAPKALRIPIGCLESYRALEEPWSARLAGKRVLVISMFADTILSQYAKRKLLWGSRADTVLPDFDLQAIRAPFSWSTLPTVGTWFHALNEMKQQMSRMDFDVSLIGASAYSLPLVTHAKRMGRIGIHLGGATQIHFGIMGARWEGNPFFAKLANEHWTRPSAAETPANAKDADNGCYW